MIRAQLDRFSVRSPITGTVLKCYVELSALHVRAQVDERDAPRLVAGCNGEQHNSLMSHSCNPAEVFT
jgi:hypothetical protein